uniref:carbonic anhydrase n=1 Tax=Noctiluca scintillans TaxID=2966 RepID=A0A7S1A249_NOCSC|mmetsp:Transcript_28822/g.75973  ORF Transcript_28822/g.75973 Transcript_28822/m.75973 type:complete len:461 (+) Transcript_28822:46-1428(+)
MNVVRVRSGIVVLTLLVQSVVTMHVSSQRYQASRTHSSRAVRTHGFRVPPAPADGDQVAAAPPASNQSPPANQTSSKLNQSSTANQKNISNPQPLPSDPFAPVHEPIFIPVPHPNDTRGNEANDTVGVGHSFEHGGSPGNGGGHMVPRTHVHEKNHSNASQAGNISNVSHFEWSYDASDIWSRVFPNCSGHHQSPIDIESGNVSMGDLKNLSAGIHYVALSNRSISNGGHNEQVNGAFGNLTLPDGVYDVRQFHFHVPSEHMVNGRKSAAELHIVHQRQGAEGTDDLAVVAILFSLAEEMEAGVDEEILEKERAFMVQLGFETELPTHGLARQIPGSVDLRAFDRELSGPFFHYQGSLTTPPCSESVHWYVLQRPAVITSRMQQRFQAAFGGPSNARPVQKLDDRAVAYRSIELPHEFKKVSPKVSADPEGRDPVQQSSVVSVTLSAALVVLVAGHGANL